MCVSAIRFLRRWTPSAFSASTRAPPGVDCSRDRPRLAQSRLRVHCCPICSDTCPVLLYRHAAELGAGLARERGGPASSEHSTGRTAFPGEGRQPAIGGGGCLSAFAWAFFVFLFPSSISCPFDDVRERARMGLTFGLPPCLACGLTCHLACGVACYLLPYACCRCVLLSPAHSTQLKRTKLIGGSVLPAYMGYARFVACMPMPACSCVLEQL